MPAITPDDILQLPRIERPDPERSAERPVLDVVDAPMFLEGEGFQVRRATAGINLQFADPFLLLDHMGAVEYAPGEAKGAPDHPHRGFETVTYLMDGVLIHRDSNGGGGQITDGATQWMTAGSGIVHSEMPSEEIVAAGGLFHGVQLWVNLPASEKWSPPRYQDIGADDVTMVTSHDGGAVVRLIAGDLAGHRGPGATRTPITYAHATLAPGARLEVPWRPDFNAMVYALAGSGSVGTERRSLGEGQLAVFANGDHLIVSGDDAQEARSANLELLLLGGRPIREPIAWYGPFVMNTKDEIVQAVTDYREGRMGVIPAEAARTSLKDHPPHL
ncbi:MAG TPA: pirin family protein [Actinomycetota bacterium]|jgi:hypothetical protein